MTCIQNIEVCLRIYPFDIPREGKPARGLVQRRGKVDGRITEDMSPRNSVGVKMNELVAIVQQGHVVGSGRGGRVIEEVRILI